MRDCTFRLVLPLQWIMFTGVYPDEYTLLSLPETLKKLNRRYHVHVDRRL
jgi:hypothetical protein